MFITDASINLMLDEEPLVYTTKGNLPISSLEYFYRWEHEPEYIKFIEGYTLGGEVVKQSANVLMLKGQQVGVEHQSL